MKTSDSITHLQVDEVKLIYKSSTPPSQRVKVSGSDDAFQAVLTSWDDSTIEHHEEFKTMLLNRANRVLGIITISQGGLSGTVVDVRQIFQAAIKANAVSVILAHNHPSGNLKPSEADLRITEKIKYAGKLLDINLLDHIIITPDEEYYSFADEGLL
jgi:DNA repair protein RadC